MDTAPLFATVAPALERRFLEPEGFRWGHFLTSDGSRLRWGHLPAGSRKDCILVGGFMEFIEKYFETARDFQARGYNVWCLDWRGQGGSVRAGISQTRPGARHYAQDAKDLAAFISAYVPDGHTRLLVAHSMGATIALLMLAERQAAVDGAVLSAPMLAINTGDVPRWAARGLARVAALAGFGDKFVPGAGSWTDLNATPATSRVASDPARCRLQDSWFGACADLRVDGPTYAWVDAAFGVTAQIMRPEVLERIPTPILIGGAGKDLLVDPSVYPRAAARLPHARLVAFPDARHELFQEVDLIRDAWLAAIDAFVANQVRTS